MSDPSAIRDSGGAVGQEDSGAGTDTGDSPGDRLGALAFGRKNAPGVADRSFSFIEGRGA
jgi:hypothetical protein